MVSAEQHKVVEFGDTAVGPMAEVMAVAPAVGSVAAGKGAAAVTQDQSAA
jgi:hypothetical protein